MSNNPGQESPDNETLRTLNDNVVRLNETIDKATKNSQKYSDLMAGFSLVLFLVAFLQLTVAIQSMSEPWYMRILFFVMFVGAVLLAMRKVFQLIEEKYKD